jgi:hypothetical protein
MKSQYLWVALGATVLGSACAGAPKPTDQLVQTQAALRAAREVGAKSDPQAQLHMKLASEQVQHASDLMDNGDNAEAKRVLLRAKADADLALAIARKSEAERALEKVQQPQSGSVSMR